MNGFWNQLIFDNPLKKYLIVLVLFLLACCEANISRFIAVSCFGQRLHWIKE